jgi:tetratricopeptide (TPR) repeat protein/NAD-dependent SIR2 family protein deacetylase
MELQKLWTKHPVAFLAGSGISFASGIPTGMAFSAAFAGAIAGSKKRCKELLRSLVTSEREWSLHRVRFEQLLQVWRDAVDPNLEILDVFEASWTPTGIHHFLADALSEGLPVFTTNFDGLIEVAYSRCHREPLRQLFRTSGAGSTFASFRAKRWELPTLFKLHGTLRSLRDIQRHLEGKKPMLRQTVSIGATLDNIGDGRRVVGLEISKEHCLATELKGKVLVVLGYSGLDDFDVIPSLQQVLPAGAGVIWIKHSATNVIEYRAPLPADLIPASLLQLSESIRFELAVGPTAAVLKDLFGVVIDDRNFPMKETPDVIVNSIPAVRKATRQHKDLVFARIIELANFLPIARREYDRIATSTRGSNNKTEQDSHIFALLRLAQITRLTEKLPVAERICQSAVVAARKANSSRRLSQALLSLGTVILLQGRVQEAQRIYRKAEPILSRLGLHSELGTLYMNRAICHRKSGDHNAMLVSCRSSIRLYKRARNVDGIARAIGNLANGYLGLKQYKRALLAYQQALHLHQQTRDAQSVSKQLGNMGIAYRHLKQFDEAEESLNAALAINEEHGFEEAIAENLSNLGSVAEDRGDLRKSCNLHRRALSIEKRIGDQEGMAVDYESLGRLMQQSGKFERARRHLQSAVLIYKRIPNREKVNEITLLLTEMKMRFM